MITMICYELGLLLSVTDVLSLGIIRLHMGTAGAEVVNP